MGGGEYGTRVLASSAELARAVPEALWLIGTLCTVYFGADVVWREHTLRFDGLRDATPVRTSALLLGKVGALVLVPLLLSVAGYSTVIAVQLSQDGLPIEWRVFGAHLLTSLVPLLTATMMAVAGQVITGHRWVGLIFGILGAVMARSGAALGLAHPLLRFGASPTLRWSDLDGFGAPLASWVAFNALWMLGALPLFGMAALLWPRGTLAPWRSRLRALPQTIRHGLTPVGRRALLASLLCFAVAYGLLAWQTVWVARWESANDRIAWRANYEQLYRHLADRAQPAVIHAALQLALEPAERRATVHGVLVLENRESVTIDTIWVVPPADSRHIAVSWPGAAAFTDTRFGVVRLALPTPLAPGARDTLRYTLTLDRGGLRAGGFMQDVAANGTYLQSSVLVPTFGYQPRLELSDEDPSLRAAWGLRAPTRRFAPASAADSLAARAHARGASPAWLTLDITVSTSSDQQAVAPGDLVREWHEGSRHLFHYTMRTPSTPFFSIASGRYAVARTTQGATTVELWHHAAHGVQARRIVDITATALATLQPLFGPYPHRTLRLVEVPASWGFGAYASNSVIFLTESRGMLSDARAGDVDLLVRRIGHEVAHEWWGHRVDPLQVEGSLLLVESLAKYSEQLLIARAQGADGVTRLMAFDHDRYLNGRANTAGLEPTLLTMADESHLYYGKGALAFNAMRDLLGDSVIVPVLRHLLAAEGGPFGGAYADELIAPLRAAAPDSIARAEVDDWFADRIVYDMAVDTTAPYGATAQPGGVRVTAQFTVARMRSDSGPQGIVAERLSANGRQVALVISRDSMKHLVTVAHLTRRVQGDRVVLDTVIAAPAGALWVDIDPAFLRIDPNRSNNRVRVRD